MKTKTKNNYSCVFYAASAGLFNYLLLFEAIDATVVFAASLMVGILFSHSYTRIENYQKASINANRFLIDSLGDFDTYQNVQMCYEKGSYLLEEIGFNFSYEEIIADIDLFDRLSLGELTESLKVFFICPTNKICKATIISLAKKNINTINQDGFLKEVKNTLYSALALLAIFSLIRLVFGTDLIEYDNVLFRIVSDSIAIMPIILCSICTVIKEKQNERKIN